MSDKLNASDHAFTFERVQTQSTRVRLSDIVVREEDYAFRDPFEFDPDQDSSFKSLMEDIAAHGGIQTSVLAKKLPEAKYLLLDGHRRYFSLKKLVAEGVENFTADMEIPASVIVSDSSEMALIAVAVSSNVQRKAFSAENRLKIAQRLHKCGMPSSDIARVLGVSESSVDRDVALACDDVMLEHVRQHTISATAAASLITAAKKAGRLDDLKAEFAKWLAGIQQSIEREQARRRAQHEDLLTLVESQPQRYLTADQVRSWMDALKHGGEFQKPSFKFKASLKTDKGRQILEVGAIKKDIGDLSAKEVAIVFQRCVDLAYSLEPVVMAKAESEANAAGASITPAAGPGPGLLRLRELNLAHLANAEDNVDDGGDGGDESVAVVTTT